MIFLKNILTQKVTWHGVALSLGALILIGLLIYGGYRYNLLLKQNSLLGSKITALEEELSHSERKSSDLAESLDKKSQDFEDLSGQINGISSTVGTLQKLAETDPELLKKYSKVSFLNENYSPVGLSDIDTEFLLNKNKPQLFLTEALPFLTNLLKSARSEGLDLKVISAFRSFDTQASLKSEYKITYGSGANAFSADQGYSEHQLGTTVDFTTTKTGETFFGFDKTPEFAWLQKNAWQYGFILSYPAKNTYYIYEPWHWRFVGTALARKLHEDGKQFYDLDQRTIDAYLIKLFD